MRSEVFCWGMAVKLRSSHFGHMAHCSCLQHTLPRPRGRLSWGPGNMAPPPGRQLLGPSQAPWEATSFPPRVSACLRLNRGCPTKRLIVLPRTAPPTGSAGVPVIGKRVLGWPLRGCRGGSFTDGAGPGPLFPAGRKEQPLLL